MDRWTQEDIQVKKFADDVSGCEKINMNYEYNSKVVDGCEIRYTHAPHAQALFDQVAGLAGERGMKLNEKKTTMLCVSAARSYDPKTYVWVGDDVIVSGKN